MNEPKTFFPRSNVKQHQFRNGGSILKVGLHADSAIEFIRAHANERGYVNLVISENKQVGPQGQTHHISLDTFVPRHQSESPAPRPQQGNPPTEDEDNSVPF